VRCDRARSAPLATSRELRIDAPSASSSRWWVVRWRDGARSQLRQLPAVQGTLAWPSLTAGGVVPEVVVQALSATGVAGPYVRVSRDAP
jgi:hypothetical protein